MSHATSLLDLDILRRDEIWLMSIDSDHASRLIRLPEHSPRRHESIARAYMRGRYDSLPRLNAAVLGENLRKQTAPTPAH